MYIPAAPTYGVYLSQLIWYSRACGSYHDLLDRGLLLTRKLLNQGFLVVKLKSSLRKCYGRHHDLVNCTEYMCHKWPWIWSVCCNHNVVLSSFKTYQRMGCSKSITTGATSRAGTGSPSEAPRSTAAFQWDSFCSILIFCVFFSFDNYIVCSSSIYDFWLTLLYL